MPKTKKDKPQSKKVTLERFESALRVALNTPPEATKKKAKGKRNRRA